MQSENAEFTTLENLPDGDLVEDHLRLVFENGDVIADYDLDSIRQRTHLTPDEDTA